MCKHFELLPFVRLLSSHLWYFWPSGLSLAFLIVQRELCVLMTSGQTPSGNRE